MGFIFDLFFRSQEQPHPEFKRKGDDLFIERTISLSEALCGFSMELTHLDGRKLLIQSKPGEVICPVTYDPFREESAAQVHSSCTKFTLFSRFLRHSFDIICAV